jgi:probable rRNA maturation factor
MNDSPVPKPGLQSGEPTVLVSNRQDLPIDERALARLAGDTLRSERRSGELSISFVGEDEMTDLHQRFMDEPGPTDVLAFPLDEDDLLGDVVVCPTFAGRTRPDLEAELRLLIVHGVLHLLGYDHQEEDERRAMWDKQEAYSGVRVS